MAILIHDVTKNVLLIAKSEANAKSIMENFDGYKAKGLVKTITDEEFNGLNKNEKSVVDITDQGVTYRDNTRYCPDAQHLEGHIQHQIGRIKFRLSKEYMFTNNQTFKTELENYITTLENVDTASLIYPLVSLEKYFIENNIESNPISPLQY